MGYVGCVTAACLADSGHEVWGVDVNADKIAMINAGKSPIVEPKVGSLIHQASHRGALKATAESLGVVLATDVSLVCVGTPGNSNGSTDLSGLTVVSREIGSALRIKGSRHSVVFRSTVLPGTVREALIPALEGASGKVAHRDFDVCINPEFLREGSAVSDFCAPPFILIGESTPTEGDIVVQMYEGIRAPVERTTYEVAEMLKYSCNAFHALKVTFANEIGALCKKMGIDSHRVMDLFTRDRKLNISPAYLTPGFAFGGSCLPKDLRALLHKAKQFDLELPLLSSILQSNRLHLERALDWIVATGEKRIGILGLSFKAGTDDLRESPSVALIEALIGKGFQVKIYDPDVMFARIVGSNRRFIEQEIPHISRLMYSDLNEVIQQSEVIVVSKPAGEFRTALAAHNGNKLIFDLARISLAKVAESIRYEGICW
jgi:GDP-mannose 6-dehydrogenase